jgi:adenosine deaminase
MTAPLNLATIGQAPKALLHDHLDGGLRPATVLELADELGYEKLPVSDVVSLTRWFHTPSHRGSLLRYLTPMAHTVGVMQTASSLYRVARECVEDLAADNVVYAEVRFAPEMHIERGLSLDEVIDAVVAGFADGEQMARSEGRIIVVRCLMTAMRDAARSLEIAKCAIRFRDKGVVGFDLAGAEVGYPPSRHLDAFEYMRAHNGRFTIHAGEAVGLPSIDEAIALCGADRLGHGVRIVDDIDEDNGADAATASWATARLGGVSAIVRNKRIPLELCPTSNLHTGVVASIAEHPLDMLARLGFRVTVNTDNRLLSDTSMSKEMLRLVEAFSYGWTDLARLTINAMESAFIPFDERLAIIDEVIKPRFAVLIS